MAARSTGWKDLFFALGAVFLIIAVLVFGLELLSPFGVSTPNAWSTVLIPLSGTFGIVLIGFGLYHDRKGAR
jgi:hypothetical protein